MPHVFIPRNSTEIVSALNFIIYLKIADYLSFALKALCQPLTQSTKVLEKMMK